MLPQLPVRRPSPRSPRPAGTGSRRRRRDGSDGATTATLLVSGSPPPRPSICRLSGEPMAAAAPRRALRVRRADHRHGTQSPFEVPPRISVARSACGGLRLRASVSLTRPQAWPPARACRRCRGRVRRRRGARASSLPSPRGPGLARMSAAFSRGTTTTPSSSATIDVARVAPARRRRRWACCTLPIVSLTVPWA